MLSVSTVYEVVDVVTVIARTLVVHATNSDKMIRSCMLLTLVMRLITPYSGRAHILRGH